MTTLPTHVLNTAASLHGIPICKWSTRDNGRATAVRTTPNRLLIALFLVFTVTACRRTETTGSLYTCPMHPTVESPKPGTCPVCHMELVKRTVTPYDDTSTAEEAIQPNGEVLSNIQTVKGQFTARPVSFTSTGIVTYDSKTRNIIAARTGGRLEKVYVRYLYQRIKRGEKLAELYSPELAAVQREYLYLLEADASNDPLIAQAKNRLRNLGMHDKQIDRIAAHRAISPTVAVYSDRDGFIAPRLGQAPNAPLNGEAVGRDEMPGSMASDLTAAGPTPPAAEDDLLREGAYVNPGEALFNLISLSDIVIEFNLPATAATTVQKGVELSYTVDGKETTSTVDLVQPFSTSGQPFVKVRSYVRRQPGLTVGQLVTATVRLPPVEGLWIPQASVIELGGRTLVFVKNNDHFVPVEINAGITADGHVMVISGMTTTDEIAASPQFLTDAHPRPATGYPSVVSDPSNAEGSATSRIQDATKQLAAPSVYVCPMHTQIISDKPGKCSICGMDLVATATGPLMISKTQERLANVRVRRANAAGMADGSLINARIVADEEQRLTISSRVEGRIEQLFVKETGRAVKPGQPLYSVYSEPLNAAVQEYLILKEQSARLGSQRNHYVQLLNAAENKLLRYGLSKQQLSSLSPRASTITFYAAASGIVSQLMVAEGQAVSEGTSLFQLDNPRKLWVEAERYVTDPSFSIGDSVNVRAGALTNAIATRVSFVAPVYRENTQTIIVRAPLDNPGEILVPGMQATLQPRHRRNTQLQLPLDAVIRDAHGAHIVIRTDEQSYIVRGVKTGGENANVIEITDGLSADEEVVVSGAYLLYSEWNIRNKN